MHIFMPMLKDRFIQLLPDHSSDSVLIQKQIFKILYALFQVMTKNPALVGIFLKDNSIIKWLKISLGLFTEMGILFIILG